MPTRQFAVFTDGEPRLVSIDELRDLIGIGDLQRQLAAYAAGAEDRLTTVVGMSGQAIQEARADLLRTFDQIAPITRDISALKEADVGASEALGALVGVVANQEAAQRQADSAAGRVQEALLRAVLESTRTRDVLRDAGIVVDPATGQVRIYAVDQLRDRTSSVELLVDGVKSTLTQKASVNYVNEQILLAVLNPAQVAELEPILARLTTAESEIDGLNAAVRLKASIEELTALTVRTRAAEINIDALQGQISLTATADQVDRLTLRTGSIEQRLTAMPDSAGLIVDIRQARGTADSNADALLRSLAAGEVAGRYQVSQIAQVRQELSTTIADDRSVAALARTALSVRIDQANALTLSESSASATRDAAMTKRIDSQAALLDDQAAAIGRIDQASVDAAGGIASSQMTIRQTVGAAGQTGEALLRALAAGEQQGQARAAQLVQIQTEFSTTLVAGQRAEAMARETLLARMGLSEAAIATTSKALSDLTQATTTRIAALETVFNDAATGLPATRARVVALEEATTRANEAFAQSIEEISTTQRDQTATVAFLMRSVNGEDAVAQLTTDVNGKITGFRVNGRDSVFAIAADKFIVGASQIFEVDATTGQTVVNSLKAGIITPREIAASAVMQTHHLMTTADIIVNFG